MLCAPFGASPRRNEAYQVHHAAVWHADSSRLLSRRRYAYRALPREVFVGAWLMTVGRNASIKATYGQNYRVQKSNLCNLLNYIQKAHHQNLYGNLNTIAALDVKLVTAAQ